MKKLMGVVMVGLLLIVFSSCGSSGGAKPASAEVESQGQALAESIISDAVAPDGMTELDIAGKKWPDNDYARLIPEPESGTIGMSSRSGDIYVIIMTWTMEETKAYVEQCKSAGFIYDEKEQDIGDYLFSARNEDGVEVSVNSVNGITIMLQ